ncbi:MAG: hypothetical protein ABIK12_02885, partial [Pseudomonadota bacterium]
KLGAVWRGCYFIVTIIVLPIFAMTQKAIIFFEAIVIKDIVMYIFYYVLIYYAAKQPHRERFTV